MIYHGTSVNECMREPVPIRTGSFLSKEKIWGDIWKTTESFWRWSMRSKILQ